MASNVFEKSWTWLMNIIIGAIILVAVYPSLVSSIGTLSGAFAGVITTIIWIVPVVALVGLVLEGKSVSKSLIWYPVVLPILVLIFNSVMPALTNSLPSNATGIEGAFYGLVKVFLVNGVALLILVIGVFNEVMEGLTAFKDSINI